MGTMGRYCKAYHLEQFAHYAKWPKSIVTSADSGQKDYLFLQEDYTVTEDIFMDEKIVLREVTDEWKAFCQNELQFSIPEYVTQADTFSPPQ
jgi:hypothetical protein